MASAVISEGPGGDAIVLRADDLAKTFRTGFLRRRVEAVRGVSFDVRRGEIFGFLGPNGAGKTTTLKMMMGLVFPTRGRSQVFGLPAGSRAAKRRLGYLPETPYFYEYLTPEEFLDFAGALADVPVRERRARADRLIARVGLEHARGRALRKFSKGMLQRIGIAQALMGDPELVILDEPMTGLDPIGRKEIRDLILELRQQGKTVFFSTHILPDVESTCDRVAIVVGGRLRSVGPLASLLSARLITTEAVVRPAGGSDRSGQVLGGGLPELPKGARLLSGGGGGGGNGAGKSGGEGDGDRGTGDVGNGVVRGVAEVAVELPPETDVDEFLRAVLARGASVVSVTPRRESLEDLFVREAGARTQEAGPS